MRILTKGVDLGFEDKNAEWDKKVNYKDYDILIFNLRDLETNFSSYTDGNSHFVDFPSTEDLRSLVNTEAEIFVVLPQSQVVEFGGGGFNRPESFNLLSWLPVQYIRLEGETGNTISLKEPFNGLSPWDWYFSGNFEWESWIDWIHTKGASDKEDSTKKLYTDFEKWSSHSQTIAENRAKEDLAIELSFKQDEFLDGRFVLIPSREDRNLREFFEGYLSSEDEISVNSEDETPNWLDEYTTRREQEILEEIEELRDKLQGWKRYRELLYQKESRLEKVVHEALHEFQIEVQDEIPGKRDGLISFAEEKLILEIHGNSGRISKNKARQLQDWVTEAELEQEMDDVTGLLIINHQCDLDPEERESEIPHNIKKFMKKRDYKLIRTKELFKMVKAYKMGNISSEEVKEKFLSADFEIKIEGVDL